MLKYMGGASDMGGDYRRNNLFNSGCTKQCSEFVRPNQNYYSINLFGCIFLEKLTLQCL